MLWIHCVPNHLQWQVLLPATQVQWLGLARSLDKSYQSYTAPSVSWYCALRLCFLEAGAFVSKSDIYRLLGLQDHLYLGLATLEDFSSFSRSNKRIQLDAHVRVRVTLQHSSSTCNHLASYVARDMPGQIVGEGSRSCCEWSSYVTDHRLIKRLTVSYHFPESEGARIVGSSA